MKNIYVELSCAAREVWCDMRDGCIMEYDGKRHAFIEDEDTDDGGQRVPVAVARELIQAGAVEEWRHVTIRNKPYTTYRAVYLP